MNDHSAAVRIVAMLAAGCFCLLAASQADLLQYAEAASYRVTISRMSEGAAWTHVAQAELANTGDKVRLTLRSAALSIEQASADQRAVIERAHGGFEGASATVKLDDRGHILSVSAIWSPAARDGRAPVSEEDFRRIVGVCVLAMPRGTDIATIAAGHSWPAVDLAMGGGCTWARSAFNSDCVDQPSGARGAGQERGNALDRPARSGA